VQTNIKTWYDEQMIISLNNKTRLGKSINWLGEYGIMYSVCKVNYERLRTGLHKSSGTVIDDMYEIWNTKLGMKSIAFSYMVQSK
jgi:hypothetical protein